MDAQVSSPSGAVIDPVSGIPTVLDYVHKTIHDGIFFSCSYLAEGKGDGDQIKISFLTGAKKLHLFWDVAATGISFFRVYEDPTITDDTGTTLPVYNHDRNSVAVSTVKDRSQAPDLVGSATKDPTVTVVGTLLREEVMGGTNRSGGASRNDGEIVLKPNEEYLFVAESGAAGLGLGITLRWYEKTA
jgi:hypothetical protein